MEEPLVSVIVPVYNTEKYLQRCIDSLLAQTYENLEFIFVDDGSTDGSLSILKNAERRAERIRIVSQVNSGPSAARNLGIKLSKGEYLMFCDSDDTVEPDWIARLLEVAQKHLKSLVSCGIRHIDDRNQSCSLSFIREGEFSKEQYYELIRPGMVGSVCVKIFSRSIIEQNRLSFDETVRYAEDAIFTLDYLNYVESIYIIEDTLYDYYHYEKETHSTITQNISYPQMRYIFDKRLPYIGPEYFSDFQEDFFANLWARFLSLPGRSELRTINRIGEAKAILADSVFREYLSKNGERLFDPVSLRLLKQRNAWGYFFLQRLHRSRSKLFCTKQ